MDECVIIKNKIKHMSKKTSVSSKTAVSTRAIVGIHFVAFGMIAAMGLVMGNEYYENGNSFLPQGFIEQGDDQQKFVTSQSSASYIEPGLILGTHFDCTNEVLGRGDLSPSSKKWSSFEGTQGRELTPKSIQIVNTGGPDLHVAHQFISFGGDNVTNLVDANGTLNSAGTTFSQVHQGNFRLDWLAALDLDGDNSQDVVSSPYYGVNTFAYNLDGSPKAGYPIQKNVNRIYKGEFNEDPNNEELVTQVRDGDPVEILHPDGVVFRSFSGYQTLHGVVNVDGSRTNQLLVESYDSSSQEIRIEAITVGGSTAFQAAFPDMQRDPTNGQYYKMGVSNIAFGDVDNDGFDEIFIAFAHDTGSGVRGSASKYSRLVGLDHDGSALSGFPLHFSEDRVKILGVVDIDSNGMYDVVIESFNRYTREYLWNAYNIDGTQAQFSMKKGCDSFDFTAGPYFADIDNDQEMEIIIGVTYKSSYVPTDNHMVLAINSDLSYVSGWPKAVEFRNINQFPSVTPHAGEITIADLDGNGFLEFLTSAHDQVDYSFPYFTPELSAIEDVNNTYSGDRIKIENGNTDFMGLDGSRFYPLR